MDWIPMNQNRFILGGPFDSDMPNYYLMITDIEWWIDNDKRVYEWMDLNLPKKRMHHVGMTLEFEDKKDATLFLLRWGS